MVASKGDTAEAMANVTNAPGPLSYRTIRGLSQTRRSMTHGPSPTGAIDL